MIKAIIPLCILCLFSFSTANADTRVTGHSHYQPSPPHSNIPSGPYFSHDWSKDRHNPPPPPRSHRRGHDYNWNDDYFPFDPGDRPRGRDSDYHVKFH